MVSKSQKCILLMEGLTDCALNGMKMAKRKKKGILSMVSSRVDGPTIIKMVASMVQRTINS